jgi:hypothetical protein
MSQLNIGLDLALTPDGYVENVASLLDLKSLFAFARAVLTDQRLRSRADWMIGEAVARLRDNPEEHGFARHCLETMDVAMTPNHFKDIYLLLIGNKGKATKGAQSQKTKLLQPFMSSKKASEEVGNLTDPLALSQEKLKKFILRLRVIGVDPMSHAFELDGGKLVERKFDSCAFRSEATFTTAIGVMARACIYLIDQGKAKSSCKFSVKGTCIPDFSGQTIGYGARFPTGQLYKLLQELFLAKEVQPFVSDNCKDAAVNRRKFLLYFVKELTQELPVTHVTAIFIDITKNNFHLKSLYPTGEREKMSLTLKSDQ